MLEKCVSFNSVSRNNINKQEMIISFYGIFASQSACSKSIFTNVMIQRTIYRYGNAFATFFLLCITKLLFCEKKHLAHEYKLVYIIRLPFNGRIHMHVQFSNGRVTHVCWVFFLSQREDRKS